MLPDCEIARPHTDHVFSWRHCLGGGRFFWAVCAAISADISRCSSREFEIPADHTEVIFATKI
jgi:hypothetical protein